MKIAHWAFAILLVLPLGFASAQQDSLAAASRRAQEEKKSQTKPAKVWDNDNLPPAQGNVNVVGQTPAEGQPAAAASSAEQEEAPAATPEERAGIEADLNTAKARLDSAKAELDLIQRKFTLDSQMYYGKINYAADKAGAAAIAAEKSQVDAKTRDVAAAQKQVDDLQAKLKAAGGSDTSAPSK